MTNLARGQQCSNTTQDRKLMASRLLDICIYDSKVLGKRTGILVTSTHCGSELTDSLSNGNELGCRPNA